MCLADRWIDKCLQQVEKGDQERYDLKKQIKALESGSALAAQKVSLAFAFPCYTITSKIMCPISNMSCIKLVSLIDPCGFVALFFSVSTSDNRSVWTLTS